MMTADHYTLLVLLACQFAERAWLRGAFIVAAFGLWQLGWRP